MLSFVPGNEASAGSYDPPPRQTLTISEDVADGSRRAGVASLLGDLAIGHDVTWPQAP